MADPIPVHVNDNFQDEEALQLSYALLASENFLLKAMEYRLASENPGFQPQSSNAFKNLNATTLHVVEELARILPTLLQPTALVPPRTWAEIMKIFEYPMHSTVEQLTHIQDNIVTLLGKTPLHLAELRKQERARDEKMHELRKNLFEKKELRTLLESHLIHNVSANPELKNTLKRLLTHLDISKKRAERYRKLNHPLMIVATAFNAMGRGPYLPFGLMGQLCSPIPALAGHYCRLQNNRNNPNTRPTENQSLITRSTWISATVGSVGILAGASAGILNLLAITAAGPFLLPVAAGAALISNIFWTNTAIANRKNAKRLPETSQGKKIRMKGHLADILFNCFNLVASTGLLGITAAITLGVLTVAFPPATLALLGTIALGVTIAATVLSASAYLRKTACWQKANDLKLFYDFEHACHHGLLDALDPAIQKPMRNIAKPNLSTQFFNLFNRDEPLSLSKTDITLRCTSSNAKHFERVLNLGFIPKLVNTEGNPMRLSAPSEDPPRIRVTQLAPPDPLLAISAIFKQGGTPEIHDKHLQHQILKAYNQTQRNRVHKVNTFEQAYKMLCDKNVLNPSRLACINALIQELTSTKQPAQQAPKHYSMNFLYKMGHSLTDTWRFTSTPPDIKSRSPLKPRR